ncbi:MAG: histidine phosphatase family protein [Candidatus Zixiibacteriota bacterium]
MKLYIARHGNTFNPGEKVVWTGKTNDLPLVTKGIEQAKAIAESFNVNKIHPTSIYCSPLKRTLNYAETIISEMSLHLKPIIDSRLNEIDYGQWTGLSNEEVIERFGSEEQTAWNNHSIFPKNAGWSETESKIMADIISFTQQIINDNPAGSNILIISSNGKMRYFLKLIPREFEKRIENQTFKVKTGHICRIDYEEAVFQVRYWNQNPGNIK